MSSRATLRVFRFERRLRWRAGLRREVRRGAKPPGGWNDAFGFASEGRAIRVSLTMG